MTPLREKKSVLVWMVSEMGAMAWLFRLVFAWWDAGESAMATVALGTFALGALGGYLAYRFQGRLGTVRTMAALLCLMAALVSELLTIATVTGKDASLPWGSYTRLLWLAPALYLLLAAGVWIRWAPGRKVGRDSVLER